MNGKIIKQIKLGAAARGRVTFDATGLADGIYSYSIVTDGKLLQTKKMIVAKNK